MSALFLDVTFSLLKTLDWIIIIRLATQYIKYADSARQNPYCRYHRHRLSVESAFDISDEKSLSYYGNWSV